MITFVLKNAIDFQLILTRMQYSPRPQSFQLGDIFKRWEWVTDPVPFALPLLPMG